MITLTIYDQKKKAGLSECFDSLDKARKRLQEVGARLKRGEKLDPKRRYILEGASYDDETEAALLKPYLYPNGEK